MKATGIVRRIDAGVIITPKPERPHKRQAHIKTLSKKRPIESSATPQRFITLWRCAFL